MAYRSQDQSDIVLILLAFAIHPEFRAEDLPAHSEYNLPDGYQPTRAMVSQLVVSCAHDFHLSPESSIPAKLGEIPSALGKRRRKVYRAQLNTDSDNVAPRVVQAWPSPDPLRLVSINSNAYNRTRLHSNIQGLFQSCSRNIQLREHLTRVQAILHDLSAGPQALPAMSPRYKFDPVLSIQFRMPPSVPLDELIFTRSPPPVRPHYQLPHFISAEMTSSSSGFHELQRLIMTIQGNSKDLFQHQYASDLVTSARHFCNEVSGAPASQVIIEEPVAEAIELFAWCYSCLNSSVLEGCFVLPWVVTMRSSTKS
ncbi:hypothetical protein JVT61DRAFT_14827 [Boletus reticuloceps]|uniref:Uncharacterized protein n=1 Tax=Boletus reticuloceps TaxID=495285 RepID=A0A8I2YCN3_9AGAM|nr:hypothetical protein JVT61DRAFT_14827 [Boletus reticuloceps]